MNPRGRTTGWPWIALYAVLGTLVLWSADHLRASRARARTAAQNLEQCRRLNRAIQQIELRPVRAAPDAQSRTDLSSRIEAAAAVAGFPPSTVERIDPQPGRRVGETPYEEYTTLVELGTLPLKQLVTFLEAATRGEPRLDVTSIRLSAPRYEAPTAARQETWHAEVTLTYFVFVEKSTPSR